MTTCFLRRLLSRAILLTCLIPSLAHAATLNVPSAQYPTIQAGVNAANPGDTVLVADGTYTGNGNRDIDFLGKNLTLTSQHGPTNTIIDCQASSSNPHRGIYIHSSEAVTINGFTVENGYAPSDTNGTAGGGLLIDSSSLQLTNCIFSNNTAYGSIGYGGGVYTDYYSTLTVQSCTFTGNTATAAANGYGNGYGAGLYVGGSNATLTSCVFHNNTATGGSISGDAGTGGGLYVDDGETQGYSSSNGSLTIIGCTFSGNKAQSAISPGYYVYSFGGGLAIRNAPTGTNITDCSFSNNLAAGDACYGGGMFITGAAGVAPSVTNCSFIGNSCQGSGGGLYGGA